jgi:hypothetical protein
MLAVGTAAGGIALCSLEALEVYEADETVSGIADGGKVLISLDVVE